MALPLFPRRRQPKSRLGRSRKVRRRPHNTPRENRRTIERINVREDDGKFIAAETGEKRAYPHDGGNPLRKLDQCLISDRVAKSVVDRFEAVEVKHQYRRPRAGGCGPENFAERFGEKATVGKPGQGIVARELFGLQFGAAAGLHFNSQFPHAAIAEDGKSEARDKTNEDQIIDLEFSVINSELKQLRRKIVEVLNGKKDGAKNGNDNGVQCRRTKRSNALPGPACELPAIALQRAPNVPSIEPMSRMPLLLSGH